MSFRKIFTITVLMICFAFMLVRAQIKERTSTSERDKPLIDSSAFGVWPQLFCKVSNDAKYSLVYLFDKRKERSSLEITKIGTKVKFVIPNINQNISPVFTGDSRKAIFILAKDTLCILDLSNGRSTLTPKVKSFSLSDNNKTQWLAYLDGGSEKALHLFALSSEKTETISGVASFEVKDNDVASWVILKNVAEKEKVSFLNPSTGQKHDFFGVNNYFFSPNKHIVLVSLNSNKLIWLNLLNGHKEIVCENLEASSYTFDKSCNQLAFKVRRNNDLSAWYFKEGGGTAIQVISGDQFPAGKPFVVAPVRFNGEETQLLLSYLVRRDRKSSTTGADVNVWNYKDANFPGENFTTEKYFLGWDVKKRKITALSSEGEEFYNDHVFNHYLLTQPPKVLDYYYNPVHNVQMHLTEIATGKQKALYANKNNDGLSISPKEKYVIWFDADSLGWVSYETATGIKRNISKDVPYQMNDPYRQEIGLTGFYSYAIAGWSSDDLKVYLYDRYDLWEIDLMAAGAPICVTKQSGRKSKITLGLMNPETEDGYNSPNRIIRNGDKLVLSAYQTETKATGFWTLTAGSGRDPVQRTLRPYGFAVSRYDRLDVHADKPTGTLTKITNSDKYMVMRQSAEAYPNYFLTSDFEHYTQLTDYQPQSKYNWLTAELVNYKLEDGTPSQGILYKPENFDPSKKYPVIFDYYQGRSMEFHLFQRPNYSGSRVNIPYFVSNGYFVFVPDIYLKKGQSSQAVVDAVSSAAHHLAKRSYVDSTKFGLQGHSLGGWETNVLVTHTRNLFAAACAVDGMSDIISHYSQVTDQGDNQKFYEFDGQLSPYGIGVTPWTNLEVYAKDSPVLYADKATTPLLIVHGAKDYRVPFLQGMEMYSALRRAGKKVWLLEYLNGGHSTQGVDAKDLTLRLKQYFDYYLRDFPAPKWMTEDMATRMKEANDLELDMTGTKP